MRSVPSLLVAACVCSFSCSSGGHGDLDLVNPKPTTLGTPIATANDPKSPLKSGANLEARGVVVIAVDNYDETKDGKSIGNVYVQDPKQPTDWSGLILFNSTKNPADLVLSPGNGVNVVGTYQPFAGPASGPFPSGILLPEMVKGSITLVYEDRDPAPIDITLDSLKVPTDAMKYVGRLVRMKDVVIAKDWDKRHQAAISGDGTVVLASQFYAVDDPAYNIKVGTKLSSVVGVLNYFYTFDLCPRSPDDIKP